MLGRQPRRRHGHPHRLLDRRGRSATRSDVGKGPRGVVEAFGSVWVANADDGTVTRIDAKTQEVEGEPIRVGQDPRELTAGGGFVWVANAKDNTVSQIDPKDGRVVGRAIPVGDDPIGIAFGAGAVWTANHQDGTVTRIRSGARPSWGSPARPARAGASR